MTISTIGLALGALFLIIPIYVVCAFRIRLVRPLIIALIKMLLRLGILSAAMYAVLTSGSWWASIAFAVVFMLYSAAIATARARIRLGTYYLPVATGMLSAVTLVSLCLIFININANSSMALKCLVPIVAMLSGNIVDMQAKALSVYYAGLKHHGKLYYYLLGNGANRKEALRYLQKRALEQAVIPGLSQMSGMAASASPVVLWVMLLCGEDIITAAGLQLWVLLATLSASIVAVIVSVTMARHYALDEYGKMKE